MFYLLLAILSSTAISFAMRLGSEKVQARLGMLAVNYVICLGLSAAYAGFRLFPAAEPDFATTLGLGCINGGLFLLSFVLLQVNTRKNGIVLSSIFMKLGLLVPIAASVFLFGELPTALQLTGFVLALLAIVLINYEKGAGRGGVKSGLIVLLLSGGVTDTMSKLYEEMGSAALSEQYLFYTFAVALLLCLGLMAKKGERIGRAELCYGALLGFPNFFAAKFLLASLAHIRAVIVYPSYSVGTILLVTLLGVVFFREKLGRRQLAALGIILAALILLNI